MKKISAFENEHIGSEVAKVIIEDLQKDRLEMLSFRKCTITDKDYKKVVRSVANSQLLRYLGLNIGMVTDNYRVQVLAHALQKNSSLVGLHLHGNTITDEDMRTLVSHIKKHPRVTHLDLGDCKIGDESLNAVCGLLKDEPDKRGLQELVLSHNPNITSEGWTRFGMALASGSCLKSLIIDYNNIGDTVGCCLATALPGASELEVLDMEGTGITELTGQVFLHLVKSYKLKLKSVNLKRNRVSKSTIEAIKLNLEGSEEPRLSGRDLDTDSLALSEPPLTIDSQVHSVAGIPIVEVSPANKDDTSPIRQPCQVMKIPEMIEGTKSMILTENEGRERSPEFEIRKAFSLNDLTNTVDIVDDNEIWQENSQFEEYEAYIPETEVLKHRESMDSGETMIEEFEQLKGIEDEDVKSQTASAYNATSIEDTLNTSSSHSTILWVRPMSAPTPGNRNLLPVFESDLLDANQKSSDDSKVKDLDKFTENENAKNNTGYLASRIRLCKQERLEVTTEPDQSQDIKVVELG